MKSRTIKIILAKKFNDFLSSIEDENIREMVRENTLITGGCITSMLLKETVNDYDLYFTNKETASAVAHYYATRFKPKNKNGIPCAIFVEDHTERVKMVIKSSGIASENGTDQPYEYFENGGDAAGYVSEIMTDPNADREETYEAEESAALAIKDDTGNKYRPVFISTNAITLSHGIQIILRFYGEAEEIHKNYDFVHCTNYWESKNGNLELKKEALEAILAKELRYVGSKYPICSVFRMRKFIRRGWQINAGQILKMVMQISLLDLTDVSVLEDQLTGVDVAYFLEVIEKLKSNDPEKVNSTYLVEILNRMF